MTMLTRKLPAPRPRRSQLERQAIWFTVGLYLFICVTLLVIHYVVPELPPVAPGSSSTSPYHP